MAKKHTSPQILPQFQVDKASFWFSQTELQFGSCNITAELTKYNHVVCTLSFKVMVYLNDFFEDVSTENSYFALKQHLLALFM